ncbi:hypothetical protein [Nonomuraea sp. NPDC050783]|uniref:hypothetical protein n=1 Tax=Nonomuraea sp. NPDC050783 TaxID=3154634 RepID=UPI0034658A83
MDITASHDDYRRRLMAAHAARTRLLDRFGTGDRPRPQDPAAPPVPATELVRLVLEAAHDPGDGAPEVGPEDLADALQMIVPIRRSIDSMEYQAVAAARRAGLTWRQVADALALESPQAAQQRFQRLAVRLDQTAGPFGRPGPAGEGRP